jgi:hypothetical protein
MPDGSIWQPAYGGDFDRLLDGMAENKQAVLDDIASLAHIRDPLRCPVELLPDLEREFGTTTNNVFTEKERRMAVAIIRYKRVALPTAQKLQRALDMAGFGCGGYNLIVTPNSPPADPSLQLNSFYSLSAHEFPSIFCAGNAVAFAASGGGYYLKEDLFINETSQYTSPPEAYWPLIFFVGGNVMRNDYGRIANIATVSVPATRRQELHRLILRVVPMGIWAAMLVKYF